MSNYFQKVKTKFVVNENKRTVICIITTFNEVKSKLEKYDLMDSDKYGENTLDIRKYVGIARCAPEDVWDETYGKRLAEYRAMRIRTADVNTEIKKFIKSISRCIENLYEYGLMKTPHKPWDSR